MDSILDIFDPLLPLWAILLNDVYVVIWTGPLLPSISKCFMDGCPKAIWKFDIHPPLFTWFMNDPLLQINHKLQLYWKNDEEFSRNNNDSIKTIWFSQKRCKNQFLWPFYLNDHKTVRKQRFFCIRLIIRIIHWIFLSNHISREVGIN